MKNALIETIRSVENTVLKLIIERDALLNAQHMLTADVQRLDADLEDARKRNGELLAQVHDDNNTICDLRMQLASHKTMLAQATTQNEPVEEPPRKYFVINECSSIYTDYEVAIARAEEMAKREPRSTWYVAQSVAWRRAESRVEMMGEPK